MRSFLKRIQSDLIDARWNIGFAEVDNDLNLRNIRYLKHNFRFTESWFADPFVIEETDSEYIVLAEEMQVNKKGRIVRLIVRKSDFLLLDCQVLLDLDTHLSFPNFIKTQDGIFLYPENGASGQLTFYKYGETLEKVSQLQNTEVYDSTIFFLDGFYWLLCTQEPNPNGNILSVFSSKEPISGYQKIQEIEFPDNIARRAGNVFCWKENLISPAQVCNKYYGEGISLQQITVEGNKLSLKEIKRIYPKGRMLSPGFHTWNYLPKTKNTVVIDGYRFGWKFFHDLFFKAKGLKEM